MNKINYFIFVGLFLFFSCRAEDSLNDAIQVLFTIEEDTPNQSSGNFRYLHTNGKGDMTWRPPQTQIYPGINSSMLFFSNTSLCGSKINLTEIVMNELIKLGFEPLYSQTIEGSKPWDNQFFAEYDISSHCIDNLGNVLLTFRHKDKFLGKKISKKIGLWHIEKGFKYLPISEIDNISHIDFREQQLIVAGLNIEETKEICAVISVKEGFWIDSTNTNEDEKTWWQKNKPSWWPMNKVYELDMNS